LQVLDVAALVGTDRDRVGVFLDSRIDNFFDRSIVPEMNHFGTGGLQNPAHDIDRYIVAVKQAGCGNHPNILTALSGSADIENFRLWLSHIDPFCQAMMRGA
jgi:hypothetical protein